ncbi:MAG: hypothetical protein E7618_07225 [Ruminococcaceae bacterium]|nr:hypothetical protein [Oscillospiraceae bacterium]
MFKTESEQRARIENINNAEAGNRTYLRRVRIQDYLSGQAIYGLGDYPAKVSAKPTDYDRALIKKLAECGVDLIQVHEEWNDACRLYGGDKYNAVDKEGMKEFVQLCHEHGIKIIAYVSSGYFHKPDPDFREEFASPDDSRLSMNYMDYHHNNQDSPEWRAYVIPRTLNVMDEYGFDGIFNDSYFCQRENPVDETLPDGQRYLPAAEDLLCQIYSEVKKRGGIYKLHAGGNWAPPCKDRVYDYLWIGEGLRELQTGAGKHYAPYIVPCYDRHYYWDRSSEDYFAHTIPYLQFPLLKIGRPIMGNNVDLPNVTYYGGDEQDFYRAVGEYMKDHPDGPYVYSLWSSIPDDPTELDVWTKYMKLYKPMVTENSIAYIELKECDAIRSPLPETTIASMFVNENTYLVVSNVANEPYALQLNGTWRDRETGEVGNTFIVAKERLRFLVKE